EAGSAQVPVVVQRHRDQALETRIAEEILPLDVRGERAVRRRRRCLRESRRHRRGGALVLRRHGCASPEQQARREAGGAAAEGSSAVVGHRSFPCHCGEDGPGGDCAGGAPPSSWAYMRRWRSLPLKIERTTTKKIGTKMTASRVALIMPP